MSRIERYGSRSWVWSIFHRCLPRPAYMIDLDYVECCRYCKQTLLLGEIAADVGQQSKPTTILYRLAKDAQAIGVLIYIKEDPIIEAVRAIKADWQQWPKLNEHQLAQLWFHLQCYAEPILRVQTIYPQRDTARIMTPTQFYQSIVQLHQSHVESCPVLARRRE